jgi:hypothetical protein
MALEAFLRDAPPAGKPAERVEHLIGSLASGVPDGHACGMRNLVIRQ